MNDKDEWLGWYKQAEAIVNANTLDKVANIMLLASELKKLYLLGVAHGVYEYDNRGR